MALIALSLAAVLVSAAPKYTHESIRRELQGGDDPPSLPHPLQPGAALETKHSSRSQVVAEEEVAEEVVEVEAVTPRIATSVVADLAAAMSPLGG